MDKTATKKLTIDLRKNGYSYNLISQKTGVSKSTLSNWLSEFPYTPNRETIDRIGKARAASSLSKSKIKLQSFAEAFAVAKKDIDTLSKRDLFMLGLGVYIGEGTKDGHIIRIINSDPRVIKLSIKWLESVCGLTRDHFTVRIHLYPDNNIKECLNYWSKEIGVPINQFQQTQIDFRKNKKMFKRGKLPYGTAHMTIKSNGKKEFGVFLARRIIGWINEVLK